MNIGIVRRRFAASGGAELYTQRLLTELAKRGHRPHLFTEHWENPPPGVVLHQLPGSSSRANRNLAFAQALQSEIRRVPLDCSLSLERTFQQDVFRAGDGVHRVWLQERKRFAPWWKRPWIGCGRFHRNLLELETRTFHPDSTRHVIVNSQMVRDDILQNFDFPAERIHLIRNGVDTSRIIGADRSSARARFGLGTGEFVVAFVGSGWERKGLPFLLSASRALPSRMKVRVLVAGHGRPPRNPPPSALFAGSIRDIETVYAAADILATLPIYEPSANVVSEALAAGLPVITSRRNGASELLQDGVNGSILEDPSDTVAVANALRIWYDKRGIPLPRPPGGAAAFSIERNVSETLALLESVAREKRDLPGLSPGKTAE
jgi:UDP-glucose:(heptosyl)LPS alpha-1,3-glucosyltransferase